MENINSSEVTPGTGTEVLDDVALFIRKYLVCDDHQLTILTLWSTCARQCYGFRTAPYLDVRSPEPHCGKTICLFLLHSLSGPGAIFYTGADPAAIIRRISVGRSFKELDEERDDRVRTLLLDDCHHTFGPSERQPLLGLINSGSECTNYYPVGDAENYFFGPKAFAGNAPLPRSLVSRCIPIVLRRPRPTEKFARFQHPHVLDAGHALARRLKQWLEPNFDRLSQAARENPPGLPLTLSPGQIQCAEPLINIADIAGGSWPRRIRAALVAVFDLADASPSLQMLWDVRSIFRTKDNPEYLATGDLLTELRAMDNRPWSDWSSKSGRRLGGLLRPFGILPQHLNRSEGQFRGYLVKDFQDAWERYFPPASLHTESDGLSALPDGNARQDGSQTASVLPSVTGISAISADSDR